MTVYRMCDVRPLRADGRIDHEIYPRIQAWVPKDLAVANNRIIVPASKVKQRYHILSVHQMEPELTYTKSAPTSTDGLRVLIGAVLDAEDSVCKLYRMCVIQSLDPDYCGAGMRRWVPKNLAVVGQKIEVPEPILHQQYVVVYVESKTPPLLHCIRDKWEAGGYPVVVQAKAIGELVPVKKPRK